MQRVAPVEGITNDIISNFYYGVMTGSSYNGITITTITKAKYVSSNETFNYLFDEAAPVSLYSATAAGAVGITGSVGRTNLANGYTNYNVSLNITVYLRSTLNNNSDEAIMTRMAELQHVTDYWNERFGLMLRFGQLLSLQPNASANVMYNITSNYYKEALKRTKDAWDAEGKPHNKGGVIVTPSNFVTYPDDWWR